MKNNFTKTMPPAAKGPAAAIIRSAKSFAEMLKPLIAEPLEPEAKINLQSSPLAHLPYEEELRAKTEALSLFWQYFQLPGTPEPIIASPRPRKYRTTSKRRTIYKKSSLYLLLGDENLSSQKKPFVPSPIEPFEHSVIYRFLQKKISEPAFKLLATHLNYLIIRGNYSQQAVIFNVDTINGPVVRKLKILADHLKNIDANVTAAYIYPSPQGSDYYLEERQNADLIHFKKLFGSAHLTVRHKPCRYSFHPTSFSQVNESMVPLMLEEAHKLLAPTGKQALIDLYCGYGLFSHYLANAYKNVVGVDIEGPSIRSAMHNKKLNPSSGSTRFVARRITADAINQLPLSKGPESIILDPPRKGPDEGVIGAICKRHPEKVLHIHCGIDQIPLSNSQWQKGGYQIQQIVPLDMFPGSANLEIMVLYTKAN